MLNHPTVKYRTEQAIAIVTIDRYDEARNAVNPETAQGLAQAFRSFDRDPSLSVAILTGAGGAFCAGLDLKRPAAGHRGHLRHSGSLRFCLVERQLSGQTAQAEHPLALCTSTSRRPECQEVVSCSISGDVPALVPQSQRLPAHLVQQTVTSSQISGRNISRRAFLNGASF